MTIMNNIPAGIIILDKDLSQVKFANIPILKEMNKSHSKDPLQKSDEKDL